MVSLHFVDDFRELLDAPEGQDPYDYAMMLPAGTWRERRRSKKTLALLQRIDHTIRSILDEGERVRFLTTGSLVSPLEAFFIGWMVYYAGRRAVVLTDRRILLIQISRRGTPRAIRAQIDYRAVDAVRDTLFGNLRLTFGDGTARVLQGMPKLHRRVLHDLVPALRDRLPAADEVLDDVEDLCPHCVQPPGDEDGRCQACGGWHKSARHATVLSFIFPGAGDLYMGHAVLGTIEVLFASILWLGVLAFGRGPAGTPLAFFQGVVIMVAVVHGLDAVTTRRIALKGLTPADEPGRPVRRVALAAIVPVLVLAATVGPVLGRHGLAPAGRVVHGDSMPARQVQALRDRGYLLPDERLLWFYAPGTSVVAEGLLLTDSGVAAFNALPQERFFESISYARIVDVALQPAPDLPDHTLLTVVREDIGGFFFPVPRADGQDQAFEAELIERWRAAREARGNGVWYDGGGGESSDDPVAIRGLASGADPTAAERQWLALWFGSEGQDWTWATRLKLPSNGGPPVDQVTIRGFDGTRVVVYFTTGD